MGGNDLSVKLNIEAGRQSALSAIKQAEQAIRQFAASLGAVDGDGASASMEAVAAAAQQAAEQLAAIAEASEGAGQGAEDAGTSAGELANNFNEINDAAGAASGTLGNMRSALVALGAAKLVSDFIRLNSEFEATQKALASVLGSAEAAAEGMAYTGALADRLGLSASELSKQFVDLAAATKGTALEGQATRDVFEAVVGAMGSLGKSSAETANALKAVSQMASKGVVNAEEMRGQLGEALPGAMQALSDATGITVKDLNEMMEAGTLLAADVLPALAKGLNAAFGSEAAQQVDTLGASVERLQNALQRAFTEPGQNGLAEPFKLIIDGATTAVDGLSSGLVAMGRNLAANAAYATGVIPDLESLEAAIRENNLAAEEYVNRSAQIRQAAGATSSALQSLSATALEAAKTHTQAASAAEESAVTIKKQGEAAIEAAQANLELAKLSGDTAAILRAEAEAAEASATAKRNDAEAAAAIVAETTRYLGVLQQQVADLEKVKAAEGAETEQVQARIDAIKSQIETLQKSQTQQQATADAAAALADKQALANAQARLAVETHGDQSAELENLRAQLDRTRASLADLANAERAGQDAAEELALVHELQKTNLERLNGERGKSLPVMQSVAAESDKLAAREQELTALIEAGKTASEKIAKARQSEAELTARLKDALGDLVKRREFEQQQAERNTNTIEAEGKLRLDHLRNLKSETEARGDMAGAMRLEREIRQAEIGILQASLVSKQNEIVTAKAAAAEKLREAEASGMDAQAILALKTAADENIAAKQREVAAIQEAIRHKQAEAQAASQVVQRNQEVGVSYGNVGNNARFAAESAARFAERLQATGNMAAWMLKVLNSTIDGIRQYSAAAGEAVDGIMKSLDTWHNKLSRVGKLDIGSFVNVTGLQQATDELNKMQAAADEAHATAQRLMNSFDRSFVGMGEFYKGIGRLEEFKARLIDAQVAAKRMEIAAEEMGSEIDDLSAQFERGELSLADYIASLNSLQRQYSNLGDERLEPLRDAIADAKAKMDDFADSAQDGLKSLQQEWAELNGQQIQAAILEQQIERLKLEAELAQAKRDGNTEAIAALEQQLVLLDQIHAKQLQMLADEEAARAIKAAEDAAAEAARRAGLSDEARQHEDAINSLKTQLAAAIKAQDEALKASILAQIAAENARHKQALANIEKERKAKEEAAKQTKPPAEAAAPPATQAVGAGASRAPANGGTPPVAAAPIQPVRTVNVNIAAPRDQGTVRVLEGDDAVLERLLKSLETGKTVYQ